MVQPNARVWQQTIYIHNGLGIMDLSHPDGRGGRHFFDADMVDELSRYSWHEYAPGYASARMNGKENSLHRHIMGLGRHDIEFVDHIDRNSRNSTRGNMRVTTSRVNARNRATTTELHNIYPSKWGYVVHTKYKGAQPYSPTFRDLNQALECRARYLEIAHNVDMGLRDIPTKQELKLIVDSIRR